MRSFFIVLVAGFASGAVNALVGGGSFISLPALIAVGVPSVQANASSTVALFPGSIASAWVYRDGLGPVGGVSLRALIMTTVLGGFIGAVLLLWTPIRAFDSVLPWLLLVATLALSFGREIGESLRRRWRINPARVLSAQFALGIYGGYFGGAVGIMMIAVWALLENRDLKSFSGPRTLLVSAARVMAVIVFIVAHAVHWTETVVMLMAAIVGGVAGARIGRRAPRKVIQIGTLLLTTCMTLVFFFRAYMRPALW